MSLPIVLIFGNHRDPAGDYTIKNLLPKLANEGYNRLCVEYPSFKSDDDIINETNKTIELLKSRNNPSQNEYILPFTLKVESLLLAKKHFYCTISLDDVLSINKCIASSGLPHAEKMLDQTLPTRDIIMADQLFRMHTEKKGVIGLFGSMHCRGLTERLKKKGLTSENFICHLPQTLDFFRAGIARYNASSEDTKILNSIRCSATTGDEINYLGDKILSEVKSKSRSILEITENSQSQFLSKVFNVNFKALVKPQYKVDAILSYEQVINTKILTDLDNLSIQNKKICLKNQEYLVIPDVNTTEVSERIRQLHTKYNKIKFPL